MWRIREKNTTSSSENTEKPQEKHEKTSSSSMKNMSQPASLRGSTQISKSFSQHYNDMDSDSRARCLGDYSLKKFKN